MNTEAETSNMETTTKDQSPTAGASTNKVKPKPKIGHPLRSESKAKEEKSSVMADGKSSAFAPKRGKPASNVTQSVSVLNPSSKDKPAPRRLSAPSKSPISPLPKSTAKASPLSGTRKKSLTNDQQKKGTPKKNETPVSAVAARPMQRKFSVLLSVSYWLSQITLSESAAKHSISLGFFKLALESGCEPQRLRDELKSYACRHNLVELGETAQELFRNYNILEDMERVQASKTCSHEETRSSDEDVNSSSSIVGGKKLKSNPLNAENSQVTLTKELAKKESTPRISPIKKKGMVDRKTTKPKSVADNGSADLKKKSPRPSKQVAKKEKVKSSKDRREDSAPETDPVKTLPSGETEEQGDKENMDTQQPEEMILSEQI